MAPQLATAATTATGANLGLRPFYATEKVDLTNRISATVNLATGNMVFDAAEVSVNAPGVAVNLHSYNNTQASGSGAYSYRQVLSTGQDVGLAVTASTVTFSAPSGFTAGFTADGSGGWTVPAGFDADLTHNSDGTWTLTYHTSGEQLSFTAGGYLVKDADRNGVGYTLGYNTANQVVSLTDAAGQVTTVAYTTSGAIASITDPFSRVTAYQYSWDGYLAETDYPDGSKVSFVQNSAKRVSRLTTPNGNYVHFYYDASGRIIKIDRFLTAAATTGAASTTAFTYPSATSTTVTNPLGGASTYTLDSAGRATEIIDPLGHSTAITWTADNDVSTTLDATGHLTTNTYDMLGNATGQTAPDGTSTALAYAASVNCSTTDTTHPYEPKCSTDDSGDTTTISYDSAGNLVSIADTSSPSSLVEATYTYQSATASGTQCGGKPGQICTKTDARGYVTKFAYDASGRLTMTTPPSQLGRTSRQYDAAGRLISATDGLNRTTTYAYDKADKITKTTLSTGTVLTNFYDSDGNLTKNTDSYKGTATYLYDTLDRETSRKDPSMSVAMTTMYDSAGNIVSTSDPSGTITYAYDANSQLINETEPGSFVTTFSYDTNGAEVTRTLPNGVIQTTSRDAIERATEIKVVSKSGVIISDLTYSYTAFSDTGAPASRPQLQSRTDKLGVGAPADSVITYSYNLTGQLASAVEKLATGVVNASWGYTYDTNGNRLSETVSGATTRTSTAATSAATTTWGYNDADEAVSQNNFSTGYSYDANGNQTTSPNTGGAAYGSRNTLSSVTAPGASAITESFDYLGIGNNQRTGAGGSTFTSSGFGIATETNGGSSTYRHTADSGLLSNQDPNGNRYYYSTDNIGSVVAITDSSGSKVAAYSYAPYGATRCATGPLASINPIRWTGGYLDVTTGLYKFGARYYSPMEGRFTQRDPSGSETNPYAYSSGDPVNFTDPSGLSYIGVPRGYGYYKVTGAPKNSLNDYCTHSPDSLSISGYWVDFRGPCAWHDVCFGRGTWKGICNFWLFSDMISNCRYFVPWWNGYVRNRCGSVAATYFFAVTGTHLIPSGIL